MELLIVTGMSGSGKSRTLATLEDIGYYCIDNLPPQFLLNFADFMNSSSELQKVAIIMDARSKEMFHSMANVMTELEKKIVDFKILFLDCDDATLLNRYKETRRLHPLMNEQVSTLQEAIVIEREMLVDIRNRADFLVNTSSYNTSQLKEKIIDLLGNSEAEMMHINLVSFGFKYGILADADIIFDVRCLPNPYYVKELTNKTGEDSAVSEYVMQFEQAKGLEEHILSYLMYSIPLYISEGKSQLVVAFGCTGGKHRSVTFAKRVAEYLRKRDYRVTVRHRDITKHQ